MSQSTRYPTTQKLREKMRAYSMEHRAKLRKNATDAMRFGLGEIQTEINQLTTLTVKDVRHICLRIKRRKHANAEDMYNLSHAFLQGMENIIEFTNIPGAIQVIVKELTGNDFNLQFNAMECLCNLSLGEAYTCEKIVSAAGSYLVTYLSSSEMQLRRSSLWIITNILATSIAASAELVAMELVPKLWKMYVADDNTDNGRNSLCDLRHAAGVSLQLISNNATKILRESDTEFIISNLTNKLPEHRGGEFHLQILFQCEIIKPGLILDDNQFLYVINYAFYNILNSLEIAFNANKLRLIFAVRSLTNVVACQSRCYEMLLMQLEMHWNKTLIAIFNKLFSLDNHEIMRESLWFLRTCIETHTVNPPNISNADSLLIELQSYYRHGLINGISEIYRPF